MYVRFLASILAWESHIDLSAFSEISWKTDLLKIEFCENLSKRHVKINEKLEAQGHVAHMGNNSRKKL